MGTSSVCLDMLIIDDEENERSENIFFYLYFYNGSLTQLIDRLQIPLHDNEEGQLIIISHQSKLNKDSNMTPMVHVYKSMVTALQLCFNYLDITMGQC